MIPYFIITILATDEEDSDSEGDIPSGLPSKKGPPGRRFLPGATT